VTEFSRSQLTGYALAAVLVVALGVHYLRAGAATPASPSAPHSSAHTGSSVSVRPAPAGAAVVDVTGAVRRPGVYRLAADARVQDAVRHAGGARPGADLAAVNLAAKVTDGAQILVPARGRASAADANGAATGVPAPPVNLNTATPEQLDGLDGVGPATARKIVEFRRAHGGFGSLQDLDKIPGIGPKRIAALRGKVTT
jgi:competence protein ComEA